MTETERLHGHGVCGRCKYENFPKSQYPCRRCVWLKPDDGTDKWEPKEGDNHDKADNVHRP